MCEDLERLPVGGLRPVGHHRAAATLVGGEVRLPQGGLELQLRAVLLVDSTSCSAKKL